MHKLIFTIKCIKGNAPDLFDNYFTYVRHNYNTRQNVFNVTVPKVDTEAAKKALYYSGAVSFNNMSRSLKEINSLLLFKSNLKDMF